MRTMIAGTGSYTPENVLTNAALEEIVDTTDAWIVERTGIRERRVAAADEAASDLGHEAARRALDMAGVAAADLDGIIVATVTGDVPWPSTAALIQGRLGARKAFAFDVSAACAGSLYALAVGDRFVASGAARRVLVIGADVMTRVVDWKDRNTCVLFGDGAGAMLLAPIDDGGRGILSTHLYCDGTRAGILGIPGGGSRKPLSVELIQAREHFIKMNGREVYRTAVHALESCSLDALRANEMGPDDVAHVIAHQANKRILDATLERLGVPASKCWMNLDRYGNTSAASVAIALDEANRAGGLTPGDVVLMMGIGAGMAWGSAVVRW